MIQFCGFSSLAPLDDNFLPENLIASEDFEEKVHFKLKLSSS